MAEIGHNGGPPLQKFTAKQKVERIKEVLDMDITAAQKCVGIGIVVEADTDWMTPELSTERLRQFASVKDRETVYKATKQLTAREIVKPHREEGKPNRYIVLPSRVVDAIVDAYNQNATSRAKPDGVADAIPDGLNPTGPPQPVRSNPTGQVETDTPTPSPSRARVLDNNLNKTNTSSEGEGEKERGFGGKPSESLGLETQEDETQEFAPPVIALEAFKLYNEMALRVGIPQARTLTPQRRKSLMARMREHGGIEAWKLALANIEKSAFLQGSNDRGWTADLDFMLQAKSFTKLVEGTYGNGAHARSSAGQSEPPKETRRDRIRRHIEQAQSNQKGTRYEP